MILYIKQEHYMIKYGINEVRENELWDIHTH